MFYDLEPYIPLTVMLTLYGIMFAALFWNLLGKEDDKRDR